MNATERPEIPQNALSNFGRRRERDHRVFPETDGCTLHSPSSCDTRVATDHSTASVSMAIMIPYQMASICHCQVHTPPPTAHPGAGRRGRRHPASRAGGRAGRVGAGPCATANGATPLGACMVCCAASCCRVEMRFYCIGAAATRRHSCFPRNENPFKCVCLLHHVLDPPDSHRAVLRGDARRERARHVRPTRARLKEVSDERAEE